MNVLAGCPRDSSHFVTDLEQIMIDHVLNDVSTLEQFRPHLRLRVRDQLGDRLRQKLDEDDLVQQTLMDAYFKRDQFRGRSEGELAAWLHKILYHNLLDAVQRFQADKRKLAREFRLQQSMHQSDRCAVDDRDTPAQCAEKHEDIANLLAAVGRLTPLQREAIDRFYLQNDSLKEVASCMNRSVSSVSALICRGVRRLRLILEGDDWRAKNGSLTP